MFSEIKTLTPIIDMESIILKNPQAIISSGNTVLSEWVEFGKIGMLLMRLNKKIFS